MLKIPDELFFNLIITAVVLPVMGFCFWILLEPYLKLSKIYSSKLAPPEILFEYESCLLDRVRYKGKINIGITEQGLFLSLTSPLDNWIQPLLINWQAIIKTELYFDAVWENCYKLFIGSPTIATIVLSEKIYTKIQNKKTEIMSQ